MDLWDSFVGKDEMYERGGLHLNPFVLSYVYIYTYEIPKPLRLLHIYIRTRTLRSKYDAFTGVNRHFTVSLHEVFTCFPFEAGSH